jgi:hypothetical protein
MVASSSTRELIPTASSLSPLKRTQDQTNQPTDVSTLNQKLNDLEGKLCN